MKRHKFNIFPEAKQEDFDRLLQDMTINGYDLRHPITIYEGDILDGWNRMKACNMLKITPPIVTFKGTATEAIEFVMRTNKRRNLNSGQWATIAVEAEDLIAAIRDATEKERRAKQSETQVKQAEVVTKRPEAITQKKIGRAHV